MNEDKGARYQRMRRRATLVAAAWTAGLLTALLATGAVFRLRDAAERAAGFLSLPQIVAPAAAAACLAFFLILVHETGILPIAFVGRYALDRRYGLTHQRPVSWLLDHAKALLVGAVVSVLAAVVVVVSQRAWPGWWWIPAWVVVTVAAVLAAWATPVWLLPRFYRFTPLQRDTLVRRLADLAGRAGLTGVRVFEWHLAGQTRRANALTAGLGGTRRILLSDTLLADYSDDEIEVILAHELAHHVRHDVWRELGADAAVVGLSLWLAHLALLGLHEPLGLRGPSDPAGLPLVVLVAGAVAGCCAPIVNALSRWYERRSDWLALDLTGKPEAFASAIRRLSARNLSDEDPPGWARLLFYTHPPVGHRLALAREWASRSRV